MKHAWSFLKREFLELLPPTIFFFIAIGLLMLTKRLMLQQYHIGFSDFAAVVIGALVIGKVVLIVDCFKFVNRYPDRPLIYNVLWKTTVYLIAATCCADRWKRLSRNLLHGSVAETFQHLREGIVWPHFWVIHLWLGGVAVCLLRAQRTHSSARQRSKSCACSLDGRTREYDRTRRKLFKFTARGSSLLQHHHDGQQKRGVTEMTSCRRLMAVVLVGSLLVQLGGVRQHRASWLGRTFRRRHGRRACCNQHGNTAERTNSGDANHGVWRRRLWLRGPARLCRSKSVRTVMITPA